MNDPPPDPPNGFEWFADQIAGHHPSVVKNGRHQIGLLKKYGSKCIHKPRQEGVRGDREVNLYELLSKQLDDYSGGDDEKKILHELALIVPRYHGIQQLTIDNEMHDFLVLEDVTMHFARPAILDVKMGLLTSDPDASEKKRQSEAVKYLPQTRLGFRVCGYRMHTENGVVSRNKEWGKSFDEESIGEALAEFFAGRADTARLAAQRVSAARDWFERQRVFHFYASSLLFVYEMDPSRPVSVAVWMIDFSHVFPANGVPDSNYIPGLDTLLRLLHNIS